LIGNPRIVLADEPTGNIDSKTGAAIVQLLEQLNEEGTTIVVITHDRNIAEHFRRQISLLDGEIEHDTGVTR
jgi:putative ABC transport system ATP-binding protein